VDVDAPQEAVFEALADARTYPEWWKPVYLRVEGDCAPEVGCVSRQKFKGRLSYHLNTRSEIVRLERPREFEVEVAGDLTGKGVWTLTPRDGRVHIHFDWRVLADRPLLRILTPGPPSHVPLEPQLVDPAGDGGARALRSIPGERGRRLTPPALLRSHPVTHVGRRAQCPTSEPS
jgi:Polyketide cyclase / dehydrase and lipid transport